ncbi:MAG: SUMF1/EgtB/PvdO family nonheme iron enzyme, partial [Deltaproteobacteria bacterium]|nr:SUMF1/EgtB/PvdO family nonheme iron enzyme [Deltaproteobacteria bacterium]
MNNPRTLSAMACVAALMTACAGAEPSTPASSVDSSGPAAALTDSSAASPLHVRELPAQTHAKLQHLSNHQQGAAIQDLLNHIDRLHADQAAQAADGAALARDTQRIGLQVVELQALVAAQAQVIAKQGSAIEQLQGKLAELAAVVAAPTGPGGGTPKPPAAPTNMVAVGDVWVDKYETSLWTRFDGAPVACGALQAAVSAAFAAGATPDSIYLGADGPFCKTTPGAAICAYRQYGSPPGKFDDITCGDYPGTFPPSGYATDLVYACPIEGVRPSVCTTWFQAAAACAASGKHLTTNAEWQAAVSGTYDPGPALGNNGDCNMSSGKVRVTGQASKCTSVFGVEDMIGNVDEWVGDWMVSGQASMTGK